MGEESIDSREPKPETGNPTRARVTADITLEELMDTLDGMFHDNAHKLTCREAEAIADAYGTIGKDPSGFIEAHSWGDNEPDDLHYDPEKQGKDEDEDDD